MCVRVCACACAAATAARAISAPASPLPLRVHATAHNHTCTHTHTAAHTQPAHTRQVEVERLSKLLEAPPAEIVHERMAIINLAATLDTRAAKLYEVRVLNVYVCA